jgi:tetratricopeptide (TPR) repeat protein
MVEPGRIFPVPSDWPFETWEVAVTPLPLWLPVEGRRARAWLAVCFNSDTEKVLASEPGAEEEIPQLIEQVLTRAGRRWLSRPARVWVADAEVARILEGLLESQEVAVEVVPRLAQLPEVLDALIAGMAPPDPRPGPLTGEGVTVERLRSFARAAADLYVASCWRHLSPEDLIQVEAPEVEESLRYFILNRQGTGSAGLLFVSEAEDLEAIMAGDVERLFTEGGLWTLGFDQPWTAPPEDVDLWERHGLPWSGGDRCPVAYFTGLEVVKRPDARQLAFFEGLFSALAATAEEDLDAGRWEKRVETVEGPVRFVLSLPDLWETEDEEDLDFETPQEKAEDLVDQAYDARGRRAVLLARQALAVWPDCAEAYSLLADRALDPEATLDFYAQAMAAGERAMGAGVFEEAGRFCEIPETRAYMGARLGYAETLVKLGRLEEAAESFQEMLLLNPRDDQGVREALVNVLIALDRDEDAKVLLDRYGEDGSALMGFPRALLRFRREGDSTEARQCLKQALKANRFVPGLLLRTRRMSFPGADYSPGTEGEAAIYFSLSRGTWEKTPGALDWLRERTAAAVPVRSKARGKKDKKKKKRR